MKENNKLLGCSGIINRRNFIINILVAMTIIEVFFSTPLIAYMMFKPEILSIIMNNGILPKSFTLILFIGNIIKVTLYSPSIIKRIKDITGIHDKKTTIITIFAITILFMQAILAFINVPIAIIFKYLQLFIILSLMIIKGKISSLSPTENINKFNWGAFLGSWIWGLFNKSYKTLWMIPVAFTTGALPLMLVFGLKGNHWAYKNKYNNSTLEQFHKQQSKQAILWAFLAPILFVIMFMIFSICAGFIAVKTDYINKIEPIVYEQRLKMAEMTFTKIEMLPDKYNFYINPKKWNKATKYNKLNLVILADNYVASKKETDKDIQVYNIHPQIIEKITIYSDFNNEILAKISDNKIDISKIEALQNNTENEQYKETYNQIIKHIELNYHPTLP